MKLAIFKQHLKHEDLSELVALLNSFNKGACSITVGFFHKDSSNRDKHNNLALKQLTLDYKFLGTDEKSRSYSVYAFLKDNHFDTVVFLNEPSLGYYSVLAKHEGLHFINTNMVTTVTEPSQFDSRAGFDTNLQLLNNREMERATHLLAEQVIEASELNQFVLSEKNLRGDFDEDRVLSETDGHNGLKGDNPLVSVCIVHFNRHEYLQGLIDCFTSQTYQNFEIILVDDGSDNLASLQFIDNLQSLFDQHGWRIIRQENKYLGAARNCAASAARGKYLVFSDDDNYPFDNELEQFVSVMERTGADVLTCGANFFLGKEIYERPSVAEFHSVPFGNLPNSAFYENVFGDANCCVKKSSFSKIGGFTEDYGVGYEDWEFFLKASLLQMEILVVPEPLFWYRIHQGSMMDATDSTRNRERVLRNIFHNNEFSDVLQLANLDYIKRNIGRPFLKKNVIVNGLMLFLKSQRKSVLVKRFLYSCKLHGLREATKRFLYFGKMKL